MRSALRLCCDQSLGISFFVLRIKNGVENLNFIRVMKSTFNGNAYFKEQGRFVHDVFIFTTTHYKKVLM